eukprot:6182438-Amphidinium_carterae.1
MPQTPAALCHICSRFVEQYPHDFVIGSRVCSKEFLCTNKPVKGTSACMTAFVQFLSAESSCELAYFCVS